MLTKYKTTMITTTARRILSGLLGSQDDMLPQSPWMGVPTQDARNPKRKATTSMKIPNMAIPVAAHTAPVPANTIPAMKVLDCSFFIGVSWVQFNGGPSYRQLNRSARQIASYWDDLLCPYLLLGP